MNRFIALLTFSMLFSICVTAQSKLFNSGDKVVVQISNTYGKVYVHEMNSKQTVYSLAKTFDQRITDVQSVNPGVDFNAMNIGQKIRVPFLAATIVKNPLDLIDGGEYVNVYYRVRPKDNLYRIAKVYFDTSIENLMAINNTKTFELQPDQLIKVGWMPIGNTPTQKQVSFKASAAAPQSTATQQTTPVVSESTNTTNSTASNEKPQRERAVRREKAKKQGFFARVFGSKNKKKKREEKDIKEVVQLSEKLENKSEPVQVEPESSKEIQSVIVPDAPAEKPVFGNIADNPSDITTDLAPAETKPQYVFKSEKAIAIWNQTSSNSRNMFALHPTAAVGSYIEITNPMLNKTIQAKVIGNIPPRTYTDDVSLVVSPRVATMLGVVDRRFAVKVKYREE